MKRQTVADLERLAVAKHGDYAYMIATRVGGNLRHKSTWMAVLAEESTVEQRLSHQMWQQGIRHKFDI